MDIMHAKTVCVVLQYVYGITVCPWILCNTVYVVLCVWYYSMTMDIIWHCMCDIMCVVLQYVLSIWILCDTVYVALCVWYYTMSMDIMQHCVSGIMCVVLQYDHGYYATLYVW